MTSADLEAGLRQVRDAIAERGPPGVVQLAMPTLESGEAMTWMWDECSVCVARSADLVWSVTFKEWTPAKVLRLFPSVDAPPREIAPPRGIPGATTLADARVAATAIRADLEAAAAVAPSSDVDHQRCVDAWSDRFHARADALDHFVDAVATTAPDAAIDKASSVHIRHLREHVDWLARQRDLFDQPDDWRDALVVARPRRGNGGRVLEAFDLGWELTLGWFGTSPDTRGVYLARGPFATGVYRVLRPVEELYPLRGDLALDRVQIKTDSRGMAHVEASLDEASIHLHGLGGTPGRLAEIEQLARLLLAARATTPRSL